MSQQAQLAVQTQQKARDISSIKGNMLQRAAINTTITPVHSGILQRCSGGVECAACRQKRLEKEGTLQRAAVNSAPAYDVPPIVHDVLGSPGQPLDATTRAFMEPRFGHDFSQVRVHTDITSGQAASAIGAYAYTVGQDVYFGSGYYNPASHSGKRLLAHELAHTIQQRSTPMGVQAAGLIDQPSTPLEREADNAAEAVLSGSKAHVVGSVSALVPQLDGPGSDKQMISRPTKGGRIEVVRTLEERPCTRVPNTESTPLGNVLFFDTNANALGIRYRYCRGDVDVSIKSAIDYARLRSDATQLLKNIPGNLNDDLLKQISQAAQTTHIDEKTTIAVTVSGKLHVELSGKTEQGLKTQDYDVEGLLRLTPKGWSLEVKGGVDYVKDQVGSITTITFTPRVNIGPVQAGATFEHKEQDPTGARSRSTDMLKGSVTVRTSENTGISFSGSTENGGTFMITFGTVSNTQTIPQVPKVECYACECPPPLPHFTCTTVTDPHTEDVEVQAEGDEAVQLHYNYDTDIPQDPAEYGQQVKRIVSLAGQHYDIQRIQGFASPEADEQYNLKLAQKRANRAKSDISDALGQEATTGSTAVPVAEGQGELLGRGGAGEISNVKLSAALSSRLQGLSEHERLDLLGINVSTLNPAEHEDVDKRIDAFIKGIDDGKKLTQRARWEKIFPFLRRVDVKLNRPQVKQPQAIPESKKETNCDPETLEWARKNVPALPPEKRLPTSSGNC